MTRSKLETRFAKARAGLLLVLAAGLLAGCETTASGPSATSAPTAQSAAASKPPEAASAKPPEAASAKPPEAANVKPAEPAKPAEPEKPMTRSRAATECWMKTEKGSASVSLDKRADIVTKCIDDKLKAAKEAPKT